MTDKVQFEELSAKVNALTEANEKLGETIGAAVSEAVKPLVDAQDEMKANQDAKDEAERQALVNEVVEAKIEGLGPDVVGKMDVAALNALVAMNKAKKPAAPLSSGFAINIESEDSFSPLAALGAK